MKKNIAVIFILSLFIACSSNDDEGTVANHQNYLIFGHFYGFCVGEGCVETFKLTDKQLFEDTIDDYSGEKLNFVALENETFLQVKDLINEFPEQLLKENELVLGCPDCADGGGIFIQYSENGNVKKWRIDTNKSTVPEYLHSFMDKVVEKINIINN